ncbi:hypothetical protein [Ensifer sp. 4252]|uniref:hypothetical protein n=1 Tax=Ensifer sp. 4252 TaxID=3373915 RepID=UPI003D20ED42
MPNLAIAPTLLNCKNQEAERIEGRIHATRNGGPTARSCGRQRHSDGNHRSLFLCTMVSLLRLLKRKNQGWMGFSKAGCFARKCRSHAASAVLRFRRAHHANLLRRNVFAKARSEKTRSQQTRANTVAPEKSRLRKRFLSEPLSQSMGAAHRNHSILLRHAARIATFLHRKHFLMPQSP